jgi:hypothetical protein
MGEGEPDSSTGNAAAKGKRRPERRTAQRNRHFFMFFASGTQWQRRDLALPREPHGSPRGTPTETGAATRNQYKHANTKMLFVLFNKSRSV